MNLCKHLIFAECHFKFYKKRMKMAEIHKSCKKLQFPFKRDKLSDLTLSIKRFYEMYSLGHYIKNRQLKLQLQLQLQTVCLFVFNLF